MSPSLHLFAAALAGFAAGALGAMGLGGGGVLLLYLALTGTGNCRQCSTGKTALWSSPPPCR